MIKDKEKLLSNRKIYEKSVNLNSKLEAVKMYENGKTLKYIASQFNVSLATVHYWVKCKSNLEKLIKDNKTLEENSNITNKSLKLKTIKTKIFLNVNKKLEAIEMYLNGTKVKDIAARFNISVRVVYKWVKSKDKIMKKKNDLNTKKMIIEEQKYQNCGNSKIKLENYNLNIKNKSKTKPAEIKLESQEIYIKKEPIEPMDF